MPICVKLKYETREGKQIPIPEDYPDEIVFYVDSASQITNQMVHLAVLGDVEVHGTKKLDVVINWSAHTFGRN